MNKGRNTGIGKQARCGWVEFSLTVFAVPCKVASLSRAEPRHPRLIERAQLLLLSNLTPGQEAKGKKKTKLGRASKRATVAVTMTPPRAPSLGWSVGSESQGEAASLRREGGRVLTCGRAPGREGGATLFLRGRAKERKREQRAPSPGI